jgi:hypothetical protein
MPTDPQLSHWVIRSSNLPYVSNLSPTSTDPCFLPGSTDLITSINGYAGRGPGFADTVESTPTTFNNLQRLFTWDRFDGNFIEMACDVNSSGFAQVFKRVIGTDASFSSIFTDTTATPFDFRVSNDTVYFSNGNVAKKWDPVNGVTNWGIAIGSVNNATGPNTAGSGANVADSFVAWTNPNNVTSAVSYATVTLNTGTANHNQSQKVACETFGFGIASTSTINGIAVSFDLLCGDLTKSPHFIVTPLKAGNATGTSKNYAIGSSPATVTLGGTSDLWGASWTPNDINQTNFGFAIRATIAGTSGNVRAVSNVSCPSLLTLFKLSKTIST